MKMCAERRAGEARAAPPAVGTGRLRAQVAALAVACNSLALVPPEQAYVVLPAAAASAPAAAAGDKRRRGGGAVAGGGGGAGAGGGGFAIASGADAAGAFALDMARLSVAESRAGASGGAAGVASAADAVAALSRCGRYERAMSIARLFGTGAARYGGGGGAPADRSGGGGGVDLDVAVVRGLAHACVAMELVRTAGGGGGGGDLDDEDAGPPDVAGDGLFELSAAGPVPEGAVLHAGRLYVALAPDGPRRGLYEPYVGEGEGGADEEGVGRGVEGALGSGGAPSGQPVVARTWRLLADFLWRYDGPRTGFRLHAAAAAEVRPWRRGQRCVVAP